MDQIGAEVEMEESKAVSKVWAWEHCWMVIPLTEMGGIGGVDLGQRIKRHSAS